MRIAGERAPWAIARRCLHEPTYRGWAIAQAVISCLVVTSIALLFAELLGYVDPTRWAWVGVLDRAILWIFVGELALRVATFRPPHVAFFGARGRHRIRIEIVERLRFMLRPLNLADLLAVVAVVPALRGLRGLRLLRLLRGMKVFRYANPVGGIVRAFLDNRLPFAFALAFLLGTVLLFGTIFYSAEHGSNPTVTTLADGYWWSIVTISTVGFGDIAPVTALGRATAAVLMVFAIFTLALFAGIVGHTMLNVVLTIRHEQFRMSSYVNHLVVCGYDPAARRLLDEIALEVGDQFGGTLVVFGQGVRPTDLGAEFAWVEGDPTKESELDKVRLDHAALAIIVGARTPTPQQADATTILTAFTIRRRLRRSASARARPLYLIAEILDSENVEHARTAGCDEVIETNRLGFALLAHSTVMPGTGAILSEVASRGSQSLYVGTNDEVGTRSFAALAELLKQRHGLLLIGVRDAAGRSIVNPPADHLVEEGAQLLYFATQVVLRREPSLGRASS